MKRCMFVSVYRVVSCADCQVGADAMMINAWPSAWARRMTR